MIDGKQVVLYNASHYGFICNMVMHNMAHHQDDRSIFLIDTGWFSEETLDFINGLKEIPSFEKIIMYSESKFRREISDDGLEEGIITFFDNLFKNNGLNLSDVDEVYTGFDRIHAFGIYLSSKQKNHCLFDSNLITSTSDNSTFFTMSVYNSLLRKNRALTWDSPLVSKVIYTLADSFDEIQSILRDSNHPCAGRNPATDRLIEFFSMKTAIEAVGVKNLHKILTMYGLSNKNDAPCSVVLMTSSFFLNMSEYDFDKELMTYDEAFLLPYRVLLDYDSKLEDFKFIKAHPNKQIRPVMLDKIMPNSKYIPGYVPSELLDYADMKILSGISPGSNSINHLNVPLKFTLPRSYFFNFRQLDKLFVLKALSEEMNYDAVVVSSAVPRELVASFHDIYSSVFVDETTDYKNGIVYLGDNYSKIDDALDHLKQPNNVAIAIDLDNSISISTAQLNNYPIIKISKKQLSVYSAATDGEIFIALITDSKSLKKKLESLDVVIHLKYSQIEMRCSTAYLPYEKDVESLAEKGNPTAMRKLSLSLFKGTDNKERDIDRAVSLMRKVVLDGRIPNAETNLIDMLWKRGKDEDYDEIASICADCLETKNPVRCAYYARLCWDGKGVPNDADKAILLMRFAAERGIKWASYELGHFLWKTGTETSYDELFSFMRNLSEDHNSIAYGWLGRMYRDGKGVKKDSVVAADWMRKAAERGVSWAKLDLADLMSRGDETCQEEAFRLCTELANEGNAGGYGRLGRMYRDGTGTEKNLDLAIKWMSKAKDKKIGWAQRELNDILSKIEIPDSQENVTGVRDVDESGNEQSGEYPSINSDKDCIKYKQTE